MDTQVITQIIVGLVSGGFLTTIVQSVAQKASGRAERRRQANIDLAGKISDAEARINVAEAREDWERNARIVWQQYAVQVSVECTRHGFNPPPFPVPEQTLGTKP